MRSTSSPKSWMRTARSSYAGNTSIVSPRTRNLLRVKPKSLRSYCSSTRRRRISRWSRSSPGLSMRSCLPYCSGRAEAVDRRHRRHDDHVAAGQQRARGRVAQPVDLVVDRAVLLDVRVGGREVRLGLVVVVVADEVLDPVLREHLPELGRELRGQRLVRREHQRGPLRLRDHVGDREALPRTGDAEQGLEPVAVVEAAAERGDRFRLVARGLHIGDEIEERHGVESTGGLRQLRSRIAFRGTVRRAGGRRAASAAAATVRWRSVQISAICLSSPARSPALSTTQVATFRRSSSVACSPIRRRASSRGTPRDSSRSSRVSSGASTTITPRTRTRASTPRATARRGRRPRPAVPRSTRRRNSCRWPGA